MESITIFDFMWLYVVSCVDTQRATANICTQERMNFAPNSGSH